jgi:hypothetical protein
MFGNAGREHMQKYGTKLEHFAKVALKNHKHSVNNPKSQFRDEYTLEQVPLLRINLYFCRNIGHFLHLNCGQILIEKVHI